MSKLATKTFTGSGSFAVPVGVTQLFAFVENYGTDPYTAIRGGNSHSLALKADGSVWSWGNNGNGQLGDNTITTRSSPISVIGGHSFIKLQCSSNASYSLALKADGSAWAWGINTTGQLGDGTIINKSSPVSVVGGHSFVEINGGGSQVIALKADGSAWTWGGNGAGQLGVNNILNTSAPVSVVGGHSFIQVAAGGNTTMALKADGSVWCWGDAANGRLGDNTVVAKSSPVSIVGGHSFVDISAGSLHFAARKANGEVWTWGTNVGNNGQLGDNTVISRSSPVSVVGGHSFTKIFAGGNNNLALKADGSLWSWGANGNGQIGDGTTNAAGGKSSPVSVVAGVFNNFTSAACGTSFALALDSNNEFWAWGAGSFGQLGFNDNLEKSLIFSRFLGNNGSSLIKIRASSGSNLSVVYNTSKEFYINAQDVSSNRIGVGGRLVIMWAE
jgi:alpha-tubulin suppressor-like RCC1 family protein